LHSVLQTVLNIAENVALLTLESCACKRMYPE
jgi:hypothetical protein